MRDLRGILPAIPGRETEDFDDFIDEAMPASADQLAALPSFEAWNPQMASFEQPSISED
jgi:hypothetical protein